MDETMKEVKESKVEKIKAFFKKEHTPLEKGLMVSTALCAGIIIGFVASPVKNGIGCNNGCGNTVVTQEKD